MDNQSRGLGNIYTLSEGCADDHGEMPSLARIPTLRFTLCCIFFILFFCFHHTCFTLNLLHKCRAYFFKVFWIQPIRTNRKGFKQCFCWVTLKQNNRNQNITCNGSVNISKPAPSSWAFDILFSEGDKCPTMGSLANTKFPWWGCEKSAI